jgi:hypothetical protein
MKPHTIRITIEGGVIQNIDDIPPGVQVIVRDYDVDGSEDDLGQDDNGDKFVESTWG